MALSRFHRFLFGSALLLPLGCAAQPAAPASAVASPASAAALAALVPRGWRIEQRFEADFDGDGQSDLLLLLRQNDLSKIVAVKGGKPRNTNPRRLVAALAAADGYRVAAVNQKLIPVSAAAIEDPLANGEISVAPGAFDIQIGLMAGAGSYQSATMNFHFRYRDACFRLVAYERGEIHRGTLDTRDLIVDYLGGTVVRATGNAQNDSKDKRQQFKAELPKRCFEDIGDGWTFDPLAGSSGVR
jgi:hypothetical protein